MFNHIDLFTGICGFSLAVDSVWDNAGHIFCDNNKFCQAVIRKNFGKESLIYGDIKEVSKYRIIADTNRARGRTSPSDNIAGGQENNQRRTKQSFPEFSRHFEIDLLTGGFPCQPFSQAGQRRGTEDDRHLWPEMLRVIKDTKPRWIIGENVAGLITISNGMVLEQVFSDLEGEGYAVQAFIIPACAVNAPHRRDRIWIVAHASCRIRGCAGEQCGTEERQMVKEKYQRSEIRSKSQGCNSFNDTDTDTMRLQGSGPEQQTKRNRQDNENDSNSNSNSIQRLRQQQDCPQPYRLRSGENTEWDKNWIEVATALCRMDDGLPIEVDGLKLSKAGHRVERLKALGNSIVPQVAIEIMKAIKEVDRRG